MTANLGHDLSCVDDLDTLMTEVDGRRCVAEAIARRLQTPRGGLLDDPDYGFDLTAFLNSDVDANSARLVAVIASGVQAEALKDERVRAASAQITIAGKTMTVLLSLSDADGPFQLVLAVSDVTVDLLKVST